MDEQKLKKLFPRASRDFIDANLDAGLCPKKPESNTGQALVSEASGKTKSDARIGVSIVMYRVRLLDPDNAVGAAKQIIDCLQSVGLIPGDSEREIALTVEQVKVNHKDEQRTLLHIKYPQ